MSGKMSELERYNILNNGLLSNSLVLGNTQRFHLKGGKPQKVQCDHKFSFCLLDVSAPTFFCGDCVRILFALMNVIRTNKQTL